jgi:transposase
VKINSTIGLDIAKRVFQAHGADASGRVVFRKRLIPDGETTGSDVNGFGSEPCDSQFLIKGGSDDGRNHALGPVGG